MIIEMALIGGLMSTLAAVTVGLGWGIPQKTLLPVRCERLTNRDHRRDHDTSW